MDSERKTKGAARTMKPKAWELNAFDIVFTSMQDICEQLLPQARQGHPESLYQMAAARTVRDGLRKLFEVLPDTRRKKPEEPATATEPAAEGPPAETDEQPAAT